MVFLVIGLGSMGKRRIRLLKQYIKNEKLIDRDWQIFGTDFNKERRREAETCFGIKTYSEISEAVKENKIDCALICTSPLSHAFIIKECLNQNMHVFTELNLVDEGYDENIALSRDRGRVLFLSSTFMYRREIQYIKEKIKNRIQKSVYHYHIGQYLPEWHPWERYQDFFAGQKRTNGCREIFAIELPWLTDIFGKVLSVQAIHKKISNLSIDYDDTYQLLLEHESGIVGNLAVDVVSPKAGREFEIWGEGFYLEWKGTPDSLKVYNKNSGIKEQISLYAHTEHTEGYNQFVIEDAYYEELADFIAVIEGHGKPRYTFERDKEILWLIDRIER